jgi:hypothetical protein
VMAGREGPLSEWVAFPWGFPVLTAPILLVVYTAFLFCADAGRFNAHLYVYSGRVRQAHAASRCWPPRSRAQVAWMPPPSRWLSSTCRPSGRWLRGPQPCCCPPMFRTPLLWWLRQCPCTRQPLPLQALHPSRPPAVMRQQRQQQEEQGAGGLPQAAQGQGGGGSHSHWPVGCWVSREGPGKPAAWVLLS